MKQFPRTSRTHDEQSAKIARLHKTEFGKEFAVSQATNFRLQRFKNGKKDETLNFRKDPRNTEK